MAPRPDISGSLMVQSAKENKEKLKALGEIYESRRNEGDTTDYEAKGKDNAKKFSFFRWLSKKTGGNMGRFGKQQRERQDSISAMAQSGQIPKGAYFDPLGLKVIMPKLVENFGTEDQALLENAESEAYAIERDFVSRVDDEIRYTSENDYEEKLMDENSELALAQFVDKNKESQGASMEKMATAFDAGRAYIPEAGYIEDIPDAFQIEMKVVEAPPKYSLEWQQYKAEHTKGLSARISNYFKSFFMPKISDEERTTKMEDDFVKSLPEYKEIMRKGQESARLMGQEYDPNKDTDLQAFDYETRMAARSSQKGHSLIKLIAKRNGRDLSTYSFDFASIANSGMAGAVRGAVSNPANDSDEGAVKVRQDIEYPGYLKAAAKIRGVAGAMRTFSFLRYNCTSFAAQVAQAAGVNIQPEDTTRKIMTLRHRIERVENPYDFATFIERLRISNMANENEKNIDEITHDNTVIEEQESVNGPINEVLDQSLDAEREPFTENMASSMLKKSVFVSKDVLDSFKRSFADNPGIGGISSQSGSSLRRVTELTQFFVLVADIAELRDDLYKLYDVVVADGNPMGSLRLYEQFFVKTANVVDTPTLKTLMFKAGIE